MMHLWIFTMSVTREIGMIINLFKGGAIKFREK